MEEEGVDLTPVAETLRRLEEEAKLAWLVDPYSYRYAYTCPS